MRARAPNASRQRGVALLVVLWACTLLAIMLGGYAVMARTEALQARYQFAQTQAHYAAEAGLMEAIQGLQNADPRRRWIPDGRAYHLTWDGAKLAVSMVDEGGKVDLNAATPEVLLGLFRAAGLSNAAARTLAAHVIVWRSYASGSGLHQEKAAYAAAGLGYGPRHGPFASVEELRMVLGMTPALYARVAPVVTIWSGRPAPDPATAPPLALAAIPGMTPAAIQAAEQARLNPAADARLAATSGVTNSIRSQATLPDGTKAVVRATIRLRGIGSGAQPYAVLRWQEGNGE